MRTFSSWHFLSGKSPLNHQWCPYHSYRIKQACGGRISAIYSPDLQSRSLPILTLGTLQASRQINQSCGERLPGMASSAVAMDGTVFDRSERCLSINGLRLVEEASLTDVVSTQLQYDGMTCVHVIKSKSGRAHPQWWGPLKIILTQSHHRLCCRSAYGETIIHPRWQGLLHYLPQLFQSIPTRLHTLSATLALIGQVAYPSIGRTTYLVAHPI